MICENDVEKDVAVIMSPLKQYRIRIVRDDWMEEEIIRHAIRNKKRKAKRLSYYRQNKICAHRTVNGRGIVARLMRKVK